MSSPQEDLRERSKQCAYRVIRLFRTLPKSLEAQIIGKQLLRSGTSVAANYRAAARARSHAEFVSRIGVVVEEADETVFWLECLADNGIVRRELLTDLLREANERLAIFAASQQTAKSHAQATTHV
jgi:four helix bundle protein